MAGCAHHWTNRPEHLCDPHIFGSISLSLYDLTYYPKILGLSVFRGLHAIHHYAIDLIIFTTTLCIIPVPRVPEPFDLLNYCSSNTGPIH